MATMAFQFLDSVAIAVHGHSSPSDEEWRRWVEACRTLAAPNDLPVYIVSKGGAPNAAQRRQLDEAAAGSKPRVAVLSSSVFVRGVVTAISWAQDMKIKSFALDDVDRALAHLGLHPSVRTRVETTVAALEAKLAEEVAMASRR